MLQCVDKTQVALIALNPAIAAWAFVLIWSTGFVVARGIAGVIDPYLFLFVRFILVAALFFGAMTILRLRMTNLATALRLLGIGALMQGLYLGPGFWAVANGLEAGVMALFGSLQPPLTAALAWLVLHRRPSPRVLSGLCLGFGGVSLAVLPTLGSALSGSADAAATTTAATASVSPLVIAAACISILSATIGTLLQRSSVINVHLVTASAYQTLGAVLISGLMALLFAQGSFPLNLTTLSYLSWAVLVLSIGGFTLLMWLVRMGDATRASSLLFLVPPLAAILAWLLFGEALQPLQLIGFVIALLGVVLARQG